MEGSKEIAEGGMIAQSVADGSREIAEGVA